SKSVCKKEVAKLAERMKEKKVILSVSESAIEHLTDLGYSKEFQPPCQVYRICIKDRWPQPYARR
ncbi:MAG: hypothetical protein J6M26_06115, partial [Clostridia bacterium]|nr:hypothetical protein [Clostridia bacterium]